MSRSSTSEESVVRDATELGRPLERFGPSRPRTTDTRGTVEPLVALVALVVISGGVSLYATELVGSVPSADRDVAAPALEQTLDAVAVAGVVRPSRVVDTEGGGVAASAGPAGYRTNVTLAVGPSRWHAGPERPPAAEQVTDSGSPGADRPPATDRAASDVSVRVRPGRVAVGRLVVTVWEPALDEREGSP